MTGPLSRRELLAAATALWSAGAISAASPQKIDTHIHLYDPTRPQGVPWPPKTDTLLYKPILPKAYQAMVGPLGITGAIVIEASPLLEDNQWVLDLAKENPVIVGHVGRLEPGTAEFRANVARLVKNPLFRGIRLNANAIGAGVAQPRFVDDIRRLAGAGLMLDAIGDATMLPALIQLTGSIPNLRVALDHMPAEPPGWRKSREALLELAKCPRVYCKVSGVMQKVDGKVPSETGFYQASLDELWTAFGNGRVMYGSNWPVSDRISDYQTLFHVVQRYVDARPAGDAQKFFRDNSQACYQWVDRG